LDRSTTKDLIACTAEGLVERGPDDDELGALAGGDEDLLAVEDVVVAVLGRCGPDGAGVRAHRPAR
jgi:hypothetical protein